MVTVCPELRRFLSNLCPITPNPMNPKRKLDALIVFDLAETLPETSSSLVEFVPELLSRRYCEVRASIFLTLVFAAFALLEDEPEVASVDSSADEEDEDAVVGAEADGALALLAEGASAGSPLLEEELLDATRLGLVKGLRE